MQNIARTFNLCKNWYLPHKFYANKFVFLSAFYSNIPALYIPRFHSPAPGYTHTSYADSGATFLTPRYCNQLQLTAVKRIGCQFVARGNVVYAL